MIEYLTGNLFDSKAEALVNTVNTVGVMGKGIALQFKKLFPNNYKLYKNLCDKKEFKIGQLIVTRDQNVITGEKIIINFPTKKHWKSPSEYEYIEKGLDELIRVIKEENIKSIALPPLGSGNGGLQWFKVKDIINDKLSSIENCDIYVYEPNNNVKEVLKKERVKLTPARAMLLFMLFELVKNGEFVSEFASEKLCYFLQRFGAQKHFNLTYSANFYGPYSGKVKHVLNYLNGSYVMGYAGKDKKPFEQLNLLIDSEKEVNDYINENVELKDIVEKTSGFLTSFYSSFGLELLSTVDYISQTYNTTDKNYIKEKLNNWSDRKKTLFSDNRYVDISINHLKKSQLIN
ncbi:type II toxin-antitoxin system antitoxin DNA ADP-ribosyl glycohydrolase DarG [Maribacter dokdonensis]|uniref:type II toxin-antitoxin system antitoxin DNA ADP-ribosyl glycohydrolase DarG n=1 Tax=Maribacter dokdonensis TaxID=320912 RepID=UPI0007199730|nr:macro domain-containing protein [Maribacter dokdonensis]KSA12085.1 putative phosphatase, C-terminal domain of histone macro H2A1 like protein [Maribacter dokdonensis DSW-8]